MNYFSAKNDKLFGNGKRVQTTMTVVAAVAAIAYMGPGAVSVADKGLVVAGGTGAAGGANQIFAPK
jgi:hypothetical protein